VDSCRRFVVRSKAAPLLAVVIYCSAAGSKAGGCSTFLLRGDQVLLVGHSLDETPAFVVPGLLCINKRGVGKPSVAWADLTAPPAFRFAGYPAGTRC
jgi:hypothetical protein